MIKDIEKDERVTKSMAYYFAKKLGSPLTIEYECKDETLLSSVIEYRYEARNRYELDSAGSRFGIRGHKISGFVISFSGYLAHSAELNFGDGRSRYVFRRRIPGGWTDCSSCRSKHALRPHIQSYGVIIDTLAHRLERLDTLENMMREGK